MGHMVQADDFGAAVDLPSGPVKIEHQGEGYPLGALIKGGFGIFKSNLVASVAAWSPLGVVAAWGAVTALVGLISSGLAGLMGIVGLVLSLAALVAMPPLVWNYLAGVRKFQETGETITIGDLLKLDDLPRKYIGSFVAGIGSIPFGICSWSLHMFMERDTTSYGAGLKGAWAFTKKNLVPVIVCCVVLGLVAATGNILASVLGSIVLSIMANTVGAIVAIALGVVGAAIALICGPAMAAAHYLAYSLKQAELESAAAEAGVNL